MFCLWVSYEEECLHLFLFYTRNTETEIWSGLITLKSKSELSIKTTSSVSQKLHSVHSQSRLSQVCNFKIWLKKRGCFSLGGRESAGLDFISWIGHILYGFRNAEYIFEGSPDLDVSRSSYASIHSDINCMKVRLQLTSV